MPTSSWTANASGRALSFAPPDATAIDQAAAVVVGAYRDRLAALVRSSTEGVAVVDMKRRLAVVLDKARASERDGSEARARMKALLAAPNPDALVEELAGLERTAIVADGEADAAMKIIGVLRERLAAAQGALQVVGASLAAGVADDLRREAGQEIAALIAELPATTLHRLATLTTSCAAADEIAFWKCETARELLADFLG